MSSERPRASALPHLPALDGLRGLAVIGVLLFHADGLLKGGYLGVDLFFVLSGYLITSLLLAEHRERGRIDLRAFWTRRARRLFPALLSLMPAVAIYARLFAKSEELAGLRKDAIAALAYVANWRTILAHKSYWDLFAAPSPLEHTWSLAIEEQFYVVWPLLVVLILVVAKLRVRTFLAITLALTAASVATALALYDPARLSRVYLGTDTRAAAILAGAALAMVLSPRTELSDRTARVIDVAGFAAVIVLGVAWARLDGQSPLLYRGGLWLTELACLALIACAIAGKKSLVARVLSLRPFVYVGTISYGLYLWHWPIDCVVTVERTHLDPLPLNVIRFALAFAIAIPSYKFFEQPIRSRGLPFGRAIYTVPSAFAIATLLVVVTTAARPAAILHAPIATLRTPITSLASPSWPTPFSVDVRTLPAASELPPGTLRILVLGDSVSKKLGLAMRFRQDEMHTFVAERGVGDCSIVDNLSPSHGRYDVTGAPTNGCAVAWAADVAEVKPHVTFVVLGGGYFASMRIDGRNVDACDRGWHDAYLARLTQLVDSMIPNGGRIVLTLVPYPGDRWRSDGIFEHVDCFNRIIAEAAASRSLATVDLAKHICPTRKCIMFSDGEPIRPDGLHPDGVGAEEIARFSLRSIQDAVGSADGAPELRVIR